MKFSPIDASQEISDKYRRYLQTIFNIADPDYSSQFKKELSQKEVLAKGPYLDMVDSFERGKSLRELIEEGIIPDTFRKLNFPLDRPLYQHQENSIRKCAEGKNIVVSTGTGSGKTESFLIPILSELAKEDKNRTLGPGVRALIIYPMNALANDQTERLREILAQYPQITFGSYTGQTRRNQSKALREYQNLNQGKKPLKNELISREKMIETPPNILLTNYAMLEYLLIRPTENSFFHGAYATHWKYIVLDEAHVYSGSTGIEVSMLLRRLKSTLPVSNMQYILTSATLGNEDQNKEVAEFASRLCNSPFSEKNVLRAVRKNPQKEAENLKNRIIGSYNSLASAINAEDETLIRKELAALSGKTGHTDLQVAVYDLVIADSNYWNIRTALLEKPRTVCQLAKLLHCTEHEVEDFVTVAAYALKNDTQLLDAKYHMFIKACDSAFVTLGKSKKLMLTRSKKIFDLEEEYCVFEIAVCTFCSSIYLIGTIEKNGYFVQRSMNDASEKHILYLGENYSDEDEEHRLEDENTSVEQMLLCPHCGKLMSKKPSAEERCEHDSAEYVPVFNVIKKGENLTKCVACENYNSLGVLRQFFAGQEAVTSVLGTALFEALPSYKVVHESIDTGDSEFMFDDEEESFVREYREKTAKQFIAFSDSRQAAAFYASYLEKTYKTILYKRLIIESLKDTSFRGTVAEFAEVLQAEFERYDISVAGLSSQKEAWKAILNEMVDCYSDTALANLGFYEFAVNPSEVPGLRRQGLTNMDVATIINVCLKTMMQDAAIHYPVLLTQEEKEFFAYNGHEGAFSLSGTERKLSKSFLPKKNTGMNKRIAYVMSVLDTGDPEKDKQSAGKLLESLWNSVLVKKGFLVSEGVEYKINTEKIRINTKPVYYRCPVCKKITTYNIRNICPTYKCKGKLEQIEPESVFADNHYYRMYQELEIRDLRVVEHTAQLDKEKAYQYQNDFKDKKIDVLSCSTTFEMGVDVGSLETVFMRNVPPSPANYAQRAGRAGRSIKSVAYALTFCNRGNHDFMFYATPEKMIRGNIKPPVFKVENEKIAIRHVYASALGFFWKKYQSYFSDAETMIEGKEGGKSGVEKLKEYLSEHPENLKSYLKDFLPEQIQNSFDVDHFRWVDSLLNEEGVLTRAAEGYLYETGILEQAVKEALAAGNKVDSLRWRLNNYKQDGVISFLSRRNVLPKYGFPVDTVELTVIDNANTAKLKLDLSRDLSIAISEYAPGSQVVADGNLITSQYVKKMPNRDWKLFDYIVCDCNTLNIEPHTPVPGPDHLSRCKVCDSALEKGRMKTFLIPEFGFEAGTVTKAGLIKPSRTYNSEVAFVGYRENAEIDEHLKGTRRYGLIYKQNDELAVVNGSPFYVCSACGYTHLATHGFQKIFPKKHRKSKGSPCSNENLYSYSLGYRFETDVIQIRFCWPSLPRYEQALSVMYGIMKGACSYLNIEEDDIAGCLQYFFESSNQTGSYSIILYDRTPGGAGHVKRLLDEETFENVLKISLEMMKRCDCGGEIGDTSCYSCLRSYSNQRKHHLLQRRYVIDFLNAFFLEGTFEDRASKENRIIDAALAIGDAAGSWEEVKAFLFDEEALRFADRAENQGIPVPDLDNLGYEVTGENGEVLATLEIAWPEQKRCYLTEEQRMDRELLENLGWTIIDSE